MGCLDLFWVFIKIDFLSAGVAQLVERNLAKVEVASSRLVSRSIFEKRKLSRASFFHICISECPGGGIGRRRGLKIPRFGIRVRVPSRVPGISRDVRLTV